MGAGFAVLFSLTKEGEESGVDWAWVWSCEVLAVEWVGVDEYVLERCAAAVI